MAVCFLFLIFPSENYAREYPFINYTTKDGLPGSQLYNMVQDRNGILWFSTDQGVVSFDGYQFRTYRKEDGLPENEVMRLFPQPDGTIWGSTLNGRLFYFRDDDYKIHPYRYNHRIRRLTHNNIISSLYVGEDGSVLFTQGYYGFTKINQAGEVSYPLGLKERDLRPSSIYLVGLKEKKRPDNAALIFRTPDLQGVDGLREDFHVDTARVKVEISVPLISISWPEGHSPVYAYANKIIAQEPYREIPFSTTIYGHGKFPDGRIWVGEAEQGVKIYNRAGELIDHFLPGRAVTDLLIDHGGGMWVTTLYSGIYYIRNTHFYKINLPESYNQGIDALFCTAEGEIFASYELIPTLLSVRNKELKGAMASSRGIFYSRIHQMIFQKPAMETLLYPAASPPLPVQGRGPRTMVEDKVSGEVYLIYSSGDFEVIDRNFQLAHHDFRAQIFSVSNSGQGGWYVGTSAGLYHFFKHDSIINLGSRNQVFQSRITAISRSENYHLFATRGSGLIIMNSDTLFTIQKGQGMISNSLEQLYQQNDSTYWLCSNQGMSRISFDDKLGYRISNITARDGLLSNEVRDVTVYRDTVWAATSEGICLIDYRSWRKNVSEKDFLRIRKVLLNKKEILPAEMPGTLESDENSLKFIFGAVSFRKGGEVRYRYYIQGLEGVWNYSQATEANYPSLPPGKYTFVVEADVSGNGNYGEARTLSFVILKPFYSTWWFVSSMILLALGVIYLFFRYRILQYNRDIIREMLRIILKRIKRRQKVFIFKDKGELVKVPTDTILYLKSSGNYIDIITTGKNHTLRAKIGEVLHDMPDALEFARVHRSYIIRLDKVYKFDKKTITLINHEQIPVGSSFDTKRLEVSL